MTGAPHIVVVDDDPDIRDTFTEYLGDHGCLTTPLESGAALRQLIGSGATIDLVLLDIAMPGEDGLSLARYLSEHTDVLIILVTASGDTVDRIIGLEIGADDYLPKPVDLRELLARAKAALRRANGAPAATRQPAESRDIVHFGRCRLDLGAHQLFDADGGPIALTAMEFELLKMFAERPNRVLSRDLLIRISNRGDGEPLERAIDLRISRLRRKIERDPGRPEILKTVHGSGYVFAPDGRSGSS